MNVAFAVMQNRLCQLRSESRRARRARPTGLRVEHTDVGHVFHRLAVRILRLEHEAVCTDAEVQVSGPFAFVRLGGIGGIV